MKKGELRVVGVIYDLDADEDQQFRYRHAEPGPI